MLLDLNDYNSPALKQLQGAASGTYNHSIAVPNIAEQVAYSTGANIKNFFQHILYIILIYFEKYFFNNIEPINLPLIFVNIQNKMISKK